MTYTTSSKSSYTLMWRMLVACVAVVMISADGQAQLFYDFVESPSGEVLATLELTNLPATHIDVAGLTFTPTGEAIFGYTSPYTGGFDYTPEPITDDGIGGLSGGVIIDLTPTASRQHASLGTQRLEIGMSSTPGEDNILISPNDSLSVMFRPGDWRHVPEPNAISLILAAVLCGAGLGRRHMRR